MRVLGQHWSRAEVNEARLLKIPQRQRVLRRQVQLLCDKKIYVYAHSIIPLKTLTGKHRRLYHLGEKPLGGYLFANPSLKRSHQQLACITHKSPLFDIALSGSRKQCDHIWGRRSMFTIDQKSLLVSEFFLPDLFEQV